MKTQLSEKRLVYVNWSYGRKKKTTCELTVIRTHKKKEDEVEDFTAKVRCCSLDDFDKNEGRKRSLTKVIEEANAEIGPGYLTKEERGQIWETYRTMPTKKGPRW